MLKTVMCTGLMIGCFAWLAAADKPDITGTWICNMDHSKFGKMSKPQSLMLKVERKGEVLHSVQTMEDGQGTRSVEGDWFMDGKIHPIDPNAANPQKMTSMSKWEGNTLLAERKSEDGSFDEKIRITFSGDSRKATENISVTSPTGGGDSTLIWEKK